MEKPIIYEKSIENITIIFLIFITLQIFDSLYNIPLISLAAVITSFYLILKINNISLLLLLLIITFFTFIYSYSISAIDPLYNLKSSFSFALIVISPYLKPINISDRIIRYSLIGPDILVFVALSSFILSSAFLYLPEYYITILSNPSLLFTKDLYPFLGQKLNLINQSIRGDYFFRNNNGGGFITGINLSTNILFPFLLGYKIKRLNILRKLSYFLAFSLSFTRSFFFTLITRPFYFLLRNINLVIFTVIIYLVSYEFFLRLFPDLSRGRSAAFNQFSLPLIKSYGFGFYKNFVLITDPNSQGSFHSVFFEFIYSLGIFGIIALLSYIFLVYRSLRKSKKKGLRQYNLKLFNVFYLTILFNSNFNSSNFALIFLAIFIINSDLENLSALEKPPTKSFKNNI